MSILLQTKAGKRGKRRDWPRTRCTLTGKGMVSKRYTQTVTVSGTSDVATITMPGGGQYLYTYNDNHQLTRSVTATGLREDYENTLNQVI